MCRVLGARPASSPSCLHTLVASCSRNAALGGIEHLCPGCRSATRPVFQRARAALRYDAQGRRLILPFKHADRTELLTVLAPHMARAGAARLREADSLRPCRCIAGGCSVAAITRRHCWRRRSVGSLGGRPCRTHSVACVQPGIARREVGDGTRGRSGGRVCGAAIACVPDRRQAGAADRRCDDVWCDRQCLRQCAAGRRCDFGRCSGCGARAGPRD